MSTPQTISPVYQVILDKEDFKFSVAHFTIFGPTTAERLHGHNYRVRFSLEVNGVDEKLGLAFDFNLIKPVIRQLMRDFDEYVLLPAHSPYLKIERQSGRVRATFAQKVYELPEEDVQILPIANVTCEELSRHLAESLLKSLKAAAHSSAAASESIDRIRSISVQVEESNGQSISYSITL